MKKMLMLVLCVGLVPMLFASEDTHATLNLTAQAPYPAVFRQFKSQSRDILWSQIPNPATALGLSCQLDSVYPFESDCTDDVHPTGSGWSIDSVRSWWANWNGFVNWSFVPNIHFLVYADSGIATPHPVDSPFIEVVVEQANYTATSIGTNQWLVDMELPTNVDLPAGDYWVEVQPSMSFTANGQTGWMGEVGIGNGQELYFRFPLLGTLVWTTATAMWGFAYENGFELIGGPLVQTVTWDFETGWQGWTHTNGGTFPAAWDVQPALLHASYASPSPGDSSMWIDSDAIAGTWVRDTALSPVLIPLPVTDWCSYGFGYNDVGSADYYEVGVKYFDGSTWTAVPLKTYTSDYGPTWDSIDVSAYIGYQWIQIYFYYDDANTWAWYASFDNVTIDAIIYVASQDVGTNAILIPGIQIMPNTTVDPTANFENYGNTDETFDVYFVIDSANVNIYNNTFNVSLLAGDDTTITFPSWTSCGTQGIVYDMWAYTVLGTDTDPSNDTVYQQTVVNATFWEILTDLPTGSSGHQEGTIYDGNYMIFGWHPSGVWSNATYIYDIAGGSWSSGPTNPYGCGCYGIVYGVNGKYYRMGGTDTWPSGLTRVDIFDPAGGGTWSAGAASPSANMDHIGGVYNDSLVFTMGGGNWGGVVSPHTTVRFYDTYLDAWTTATSFPGVGRGCHAGGVVGEYIIVAAGYDGSSTYRSDYIVGTIDPANCANITWGSPTTIPSGFEGRYRVSSGVDVSDTPQLWVTCGQGMSNPQCADIWSYDPTTDTWINWNQPKNLAIGNVAPVAVTETSLGDQGVFVAGGYTGAYVTDHEVFHTGVFGIEEKPGQDELSSTFGFAPNMPNPSKGYTAITYTTTKASNVSLKVYDGIGRLVRTVVNQVNQAPGTKTVYWNGKDDSHRDVANGIYFFKLEAEGQIDTYKLILVR